jgi:hypothetical protein
MVDAWHQIFMDGGVGVGSEGKVVRWIFSEDKFFIVNTNDVKMRATDMNNRVKFVFGDRFSVMKII